MARFKHVDGRTVEISTEEEAAIVASQPGPSDPIPSKRPPTKAELLARLDEIEALVRALPGV